MIDFNPSNRIHSNFGYSPVRDALHSVYKLFGLVTSLTYPRALDTNHWTTENIQDWQEVAKNIVLQYNKSTEGTWFTDLDSQLATLEGKAAGVISLFYHFFRRNIDGKAQFNYFKQKTEPLISQIGGKKIAIVDMETKDGVDNLTGNGNFKGFSNEAHAAGYFVGLYINPSDWVEFGLGSWVNTYVDFYILAHWKPGNNPDKPAGIDPAKIAMQQEGVLGLHNWIQPVPGLIPQMDANLLLWPLTQWETFTGQKYEPNETPPPDPDPIGDFMQTADVIYLPPGTTYRNIRSKPHSSGSQIGIDVGDVVLLDNELPVFETVTNSEGTWFHLKKGEIVGWVLAVAAGVTYLKLSDPIPTLKLQAIQTTNLRYYNTLNGQGKPIMKTPPSGSRPQFLEGTLIIADPVIVDCDGQTEAYRVLNGHMAYPVTYTPPAGYTGWFVLEDEVIEL